MAKLHFVKVAPPYMDFNERQEFAREIEKALQALGRPDDKVLVLSDADWLGSEEI